MIEPAPSPGPSSSARMAWAEGLLHAGGLSGAIYIFWRLSRAVVNVVNYAVEPAGLPASPAALIGPVLFLFAWWVPERRPERARLSSRMIGAAGAMVLIAIAGLWFAGAECQFAAVAVAVAAMGAVLRGRAESGAWRPTPAWLEHRAFWLLALAIGLATYWHAAEQVRFWRHFMLGYADFGLFTTELEHCLPYKDVGPLRFADTRLGYHAIFFFYALAPLYALFRSPVFLMVIGPLALNLAAIPIYATTVQRGGARTAGLLAGLAWLVLPSITRMPYANTYGFQSVYLAVPWIAAWLSFGLAGRWAWSHVCMAVALLCEETVCGVAFGWGLYLVLFGQRRRDGILIMGASLAYLLLATQLVIPAFHASETYTRVRLFGDLTPGSILARLLRERAWLYALALTAPLLPWLWFWRRLLIAMVPTLFLVCLMQEPDYLNIKYWHQSTILPFVFAASVLGVVVSGRDDQRRNGEESSGAFEGRASRWGGGQALALLAAVFVYHQWMGWSPMTQPRRFSEAATNLAAPDPRSQVVEALRRDYPRERFVVIATERMAAHFIDYRSVLSLSSASLNADYGGPALLVFDSTDRWDRKLAQAGTDGIFNTALEAGFRPLAESGPVLIWGRDVVAAGARPEPGMD